MLGAKPRVSGGRKASGLWPARRNIGPRDSRVAAGGCVKPPVETRLSVFWGRPETPELEGT